MPGGRPTVLTEKVIQKLEDAYLSDATHGEAAIYAGIALSTLNLYKKQNPEFSDRIEKLRGQTGLKAKINIRKSIEDGDKPDSKWYLERRDPEFKQKSATDVTLGAHKSLVDAIHAAKKGKG